MRYQLGLIGGGNMAEAIVRAVIEQRLIDPKAVIVADPAPARRKVMADMGVEVTEDNAAVIGGSEQVLLATKPQTFPAVANQLKAMDPNRQIVITIMAGISTTKIESLVGLPLRVVRVMPNTPLMVGLGMSGIARGARCRAGDEELAVKMFMAAGEVVQVEEKFIDAITAVSGSGPAYVYYLAESMVEAGKSLGLSGEMADLLARQTILGAAHMLKASADSPAELRRKVTSPGGTTQAAIEHMEAAKVRPSIVEGIRKAEARGKELGK